MKSINILCATDNNYAPYCGVMLTSVFENNKDFRVSAYVLIDKPMNKGNVMRFGKMANKYGGSVEFVMVDKSFLEKFPIKGMDYWSIATYYRLYAEKLLPETVDRVLYLDCDIIVTGSLAQLWDIDLSGQAVAVVPDIFAFSDERQNHLQYPVSAGYFNAGVVLINLEYWRANGIGEQCLNYLSNCYERIEYNDQDVLNAVLYDKKIDLPLTYNYQLQFLMGYFYEKQSSLMQDQIQNTFDNPIIVHYAYPIKPWSVMYYKMPYLDIWVRYHKLSFWRHTFKKLPKHKVLRKLMKRYIMWPLGMMDYHSGFIKW